MGSSSSGNHGGKRTTRQMRTLDVRRMQRDGQLQAGRLLSLSWSQGGEVVATLGMKVEADSVMLHYQRKAGGTWQASMDYPVRLDWTPCHYGGLRAWWLCPGVGCGRRVALLYGGSVFACRHCHELAYKSQRETHDDRAFRRANKLRARLGWVPGVIHGAGSKPKGMHWKTFWRLHASHDASALEALGGLTNKYESAMKSLKKIRLLAR